MKILIGYEGSSAGEAAVADAARAGLPLEGEATVLTVADVLPPADEPPPASIVRAMPALALAQERAKKSVAEAAQQARRGADAVRAVLPGWRVTAESTADAPAWALFKKARDAGADLVIVGCRPQSGLARWVLGSVSQKVLAECPVSVRIARPRAAGTAGPLRVLLAVDGSADAERAVATVLERRWPPQTAVRVVAAVDDRMRQAPLTVPSLARWMLPTDTDPDAWIGRYVESVERRLTEKGLAASGRVRPGDPRTVILDQAKRWRADAIFLGARGLSRWERVLLGSVSAAVAARASCSVEVVRSGRRPGRDGF